VAPTKSPVTIRPRHHGVQTQEKNIACDDEEECNEEGSGDPGTTEEIFVTSATGMHEQKSQQQSGGRGKGKGLSAVSVLSIGKGCRKSGCRSIRAVLIQGSIQFIEYRRAGGGGGERGTGRGGRGAARDPRLLEAGIFKSPAIFLKRRLRQSI
jgi:hypothetical protein